MCLQEDAGVARLGERGDGRGRDGGVLDGQEVGDRTLDRGNWDHYRYASHSNRDDRDAIDQACQVAMVDHHLHLSQYLSLWNLERE